MLLIFAAIPLLTVSQAQISQDATPLYPGNG